MYVTYFEIGRVDALDAIGLGLDRLKREGYQFVITRIEVRFRNAATAGDDLDIHTWVSEFGRASTVWEQEIQRGSELIASAKVTVAVTDATGRPTRPPAHLFETLRALAVD